MDACAFDTLFRQITELTSGQCKRLLASLNDTIAAAGRGPVTKAQLHKHLAPVLAHDTLLVTDGNRAYRTFAREAGVEHAFVSVSAGVRVADHQRGPVHVQNVNAYHSRFHGWLRRFNGVATRYLPNYLGWCWAIDQERIHSPEMLLRAAIGVFNT